jgi:hypothetical protein
MAKTPQFAVRKCLFEVTLIGNYISGSKRPENPKFRNCDARFSAKSIHTNYFWTVRHRRKISRDSQHKIGVEESNGEVYFVLRRHPVVKDTSGPILTPLKTRKTCERLEVDEKCQCNTNSKLMSGNRFVTIYSIWSSPNDQNHFRSDYKTGNNADNFWKVRDGRQISI